MANPQLADTLVKLLAAWLLISGAAMWAQARDAELARRMLTASLRGLAQLLLLAFALHWIFGIRAHWAQALLIAGFCVIAARTSAGHHRHPRLAWPAACAGLMAACAITLPWLAITGAVHADTRTLIPLGSMVAANGMNAVSIMFEHDKRVGPEAANGLRMALIPTVDTLRVAGLVHMPGIFVGMTLAGSPPLSAATAQLVVLYMIVASSFTACMISLASIRYMEHRAACV